MTETMDDAASQNLGERPTIDADVAACVNYASWQNSVPLLRSLEISNHSSLPLSGLKLEVSSSPACLRPKSWVIDRLAADSGLTLGDRDIRLAPDYLRGLDEAERGLVTFRLLQRSRCWIPQIA